MTFRIEAAETAQSVEVRVIGHTEAFTEWFLERERKGYAEVWGVAEEKVTVSPA